MPLGTWSIFKLDMQKSFVLLIILSYRILKLSGFNLINFQARFSRKRGAIRTNFVLPFRLTFTRRIRLWSVVIVITCSFSKWWSFKKCCLSLVILKKKNPLIIFPSKIIKKLRKHVFVKVNFVSPVTFIYWNNVHDSLYNI